MGARITHSVEPLILESRLDDYADGLTPRELHVVRWHGPVPRIDQESYRLTVRARPGSEVEFSLDELMRMPSRDVTAVLECAGNGRGLSGWDGVEGTPWGFGGVSCSVWTGVSIAAVLDRTDFDPHAVEVVFTGVGDPPVRRSLPLNTVRDPDTLLAWAHGHALLLPEHGSPLRLVVPGWYGMAWIKALVRIEATRVRWRGEWDNALYALQGQDFPSSPRLTLQNVKSVIVSPEPGSRPAAGVLDVAGYAWSGAGDIREVALSVDDGPYWEAQLGEHAGRGWTPWRARWQATAGAHTLRARATDEAGNVQPPEDGVPFNKLGYGFNGTTAVWVTVH